MYKYLVSAFVNIIADFRKQENSQVWNSAFPRLLVYQFLLLYSGHSVPKHP